MNLTRLVSVYLDTSAVATALMPGIANSAACSLFCDSLKTDRTRVVTSHILRLEFAQLWSRLPGTPVVDTATVRAFRLGAWDRNVAVRSDWMNEGVARLETLLAGFRDVVELPFTIETWREGIEIMARLRLRSHDAIHVATALTAGVPDFATVDADFRRVPALRLQLLRDPAPTTRL